MSLGRPELIEPNEIPKSFLHESKRTIGVGYTSCDPIVRVSWAIFVASGKKVSYDQRALK